MFYRTVNKQSRAADELLHP